MQRTSFITALALGTMLGLGGLTMAAPAQAIGLQFGPGGAHFGPYGGYGYGPRRGYYGGGRGFYGQRDWNDYGYRGVHRRGFYGNNYGYRRDYGY